ncbi:MAG: short-chain dehydrogenase/reductase [Bradyrhizobium sp.]|nr:short-chain dehydrogenase/reductase [Bradyrhizobium sp.]
MARPQRIQELFGLDGKVAAITGAGHGIGAETARLLADAGATVAIIDRNPDRAEKLVADITAQGGKARAFIADVSGQDAVKAVFAEIRAALGRLDVQVNNAGIFPFEDFIELSGAEISRIMEGNLHSLVFCMQEGIKLMREHGEGGRIINMTSNAGWRPVTKNNVIYGASKAGISNITQSTAYAFAGENILINAVAPGGTETEGAMRRLGDSEQPPEGPILQPDRLPVGRFGRPIDMAAAVLFLASAASSYITGQIIMVDGGFDVS